MEARIVADLKDLATHFKMDPSIPELPNSIIEKAFNTVPEYIGGEKMDFDDLDVDFWKDFYPALNDYTAEALDDESDNDQFPNYNYIMFTFGAHFFSRVDGCWVDEVDEWHIPWYCSLLWADLQYHQEGACQAGWLWVWPTASSIICMGV